MSESDSKRDRTTSQENNVLNTENNVNHKPENVKTNTEQQNSETFIAGQKSEDKSKKNNDINLEDSENQIITEPVIPNRNIEGDQKKADDKKLEKGLNNDYMNIDPQKSGESDILKDNAIIEPNAKETSDQLENSGKEIDFYYSEPESHLLKDLKKLLKIKLKRKSKKNGKYPETDCRIKVETWEKHDKDECTGEDYTLVGELLFPVCSKDIFYQDPGVPIRNSQKSYTLNDPEKFGKPVFEKRLYAYPDKIIPASVFKRSADEQKEMEEWLALHPETANQIGRCNICKHN